MSDTAEAKAETPNDYDILTHLRELFTPGAPPQGVAPEPAPPEAWFEIVWDFYNTRHFSPTQLDEAAAFAIARNKAGSKVYVTPGLRHGKALGKDGAGTKENFLMSYYAWTEYDQEGDDARIWALLKEKDLRPTLVVTTGLVPWPRRHLYFRLKEAITSFPEMDAVNKALGDFLGADKVFDARRIMRLAGTVNYPRADKVGRVVEMTTLTRPPAPTYSAAHLLALGEGADNVINLGDRKPGRDLDEIIDLLKQTKRDGEWNNNMIRAVASLVGKGWTDDQIKGMCHAYCDDGFNDSDLEKRIKSARKKFNKPEPQPSNRPTVKIVAGQIHLINDEVQAGLIGTNLFQWGKMIVRPDLVVLHDRRGEPVSVPGFVGLNPSQLFTHAHTHINFQKYSKIAEDWVPGDYPERYVKALHSLAGHLKFKQLNAVITAPIVFADGTVFQTPGHDEKTGLFYDPMGVKFPPIPEHPTRDDALKALALLKTPIKLYPFKVSDGETKEHNTALSVALSLIITMTNRQAWPAVPGHGFSGNRAGVGKGKLVAVASITAYGVMPGVIKQGQKDEEFEKVLTAMAQKGVTHIAIDNAYRALKGDLLDQLITEAKVELRIMGFGKIATVLNNYTITATGNNLIITDDAVRRWLLGEIESQSEQPELEQFEFNPIDEARRLRPELVTAVGIILKAYIRAGRPGQLPKFGSFEEWSADVPSALVWLGEKNPVDTVEIVRSKDPKIKGTLRLFAVLSAHLDGGELSISELVKKAKATYDRSESEAGSDIIEGSLKHPELLEVLKELSSDLYPLKIGTKLSKLVNAWHSGLKLYKIEPSSGHEVAKWGVEKRSKTLL